jgi:hypothetical protein
MTPRLPSAAMKTWLRSTPVECGLHGPRAQNAAVREHDLQREHLLTHAAVLPAQEAEPARRDGAADRGDGDRPQVVAKHQPVRREFAVHVGKHGAALHPRRA